MLGQNLTRLFKPGLLIGLNLSLRACSDVQV